MKLSIIIPVYHEEKTIEKVIKQIGLKVKTQHEILIIYDSKQDPTYGILMKIKNNYKAIKPLQNYVGSNKGVINAIKTGIQKSRGEAIVILMADLSDDIRLVDKMYKLTKENFDIICGSRYMQGGKKVGGPVGKTLLSKIAGLSLYHIFKIPTHDATNAFKMYRKKIFRDIVIESTGGFEYSLEIILKAHKKGYKITELPTTWYDREEGKSNFKLFRWLPKYINTYLLILKRI
jgi:glycosyltransferase involved in cell wall biosynthesis